MSGVVIHFRDGDGNLACDADGTVATPWVDRVTCSTCTGVLQRRSADRLPDRATISVGMARTDALRSGVLVRLDDERSRRRCRR